MKNRKEISDIELDELFRKASKSINPEFEEKSWIDLESKLENSDIDTKGGFFNYRNLLAIFGILFLLGVVITNYFWDSNETHGTKNATSSNIKENTISDITKIEDDKNRTSKVELPSLGNEISENNQIEKTSSTTSTATILKEEKATSLSHSTQNKTAIVFDKSNSGIANNSSTQRLVEKKIFGQKAEGRSVKEDESQFNRGDAQNSLKKSFVANLPLEISRRSYVNIENAFSFDQKIEGFNRETKTIAIESKEKRGNKIYFSIGVSPDFSKVIENSFLKMGHNWSAQLEYHLDKRWSIHTGLIVSEKFYGTKVDGMHWPDNWGEMPKEMMGMEGNCNVLDIPLNIRYNIKFDHNAKMYILGGVSSFILLKENYEYIYPEGYSREGMKTTWSSKKNGFLAAGMANFAIGYERKLNDIFSLQVEPFVKIPIRDFGNSQVKLASTGIFLTGKLRIK
jgi:hypothetical protein